MNNTTLLWVWLAEALGADNGNGVRLLHALQSPAAIYAASRDTLSKHPFLSSKELDNLCDKSLAAARWILETAANENIGVLCYDMPLYPERLRRIQNPPLVLYYRGNFKGLADKLVIAVVGTRKMDDAGRKVSYRIAFELASVGVTVVSGMALGVDSTAHRAALDAGGYTIAVLGSAINVCYPPEHKELYDTLIRRGCVISEYAPQTKTQGWFFPQRNRIISGLCQGTLVTEGDDDSGALITAKCALAQGRDLFATPGDPNDPLRVGTNDLIKSGAYPVTQTTDILSHYDKLYTTLHTERLFDRNIYLNYDETGEKHSYRTFTAFDRAPKQEELREIRYELPEEVRGRTHIAANTGRPAQITQRVEEKEAPAVNLTLGDLMETAPQAAENAGSKKITVKDEKEASKKPTPRIPSIKRLFMRSDKPLVTKEEPPQEDEPIAYTQEESDTWEDVIAQRKAKKKHRVKEEAIDACPEDDTPYTLPEGITEEETRLLTALAEKKTVDDLCNLGFPMSDLLTSLTMLEIDGHVTALPGGYFIRKKKKS